MAKIKILPNPLSIFVTKSIVVQNRILFLKKRNIVMNWLHDVLFTILALVLLTSIGTMWLQILESFFYTIDL